MFNPELEVPSRELCKRLKNLGYPQESNGGWYWVLYKQPTYKRWVIGFKNNKFNPKEWLIFCDDVWLTMNTVIEYVKAPSCRELLEVKEKGIIIDIWYDSSIQRFNVKCLVEKENFNFPPCQLEFGEKLPDLLAKIRIWLAENGYVEFK